MAPYDGAVGGIDCQNMTEACARKQPAVGYGKTATETVLLATLNARIDVPQTVAGIGVVGADLCHRINCKNTPPGHHRCR